MLEAAEYSEGWNIALDGGGYVPPPNMHQNSSWHWGHIMGPKYTQVPHPKYWRGQAPWGLWFSACVLYILCTGTGYHKIITSKNFSLFWSCVFVKIYPASQPAIGNRPTKQRQVYTQLIIYAHRCQHMYTCTHAHPNKHMYTCAQTHAYMYRCAQVYTYTYRCAQIPTGKTHLIKLWKAYIRKIKLLICKDLTRFTRHYLTVYSCHQARNWLKTTTMWWHLRLGKGQQWHGIHPLLARVPHQETSLPAVVSQDLLILDSCDAMEVPTGRPSGSILTEDD